MGTAQNPEWLKQDPRNRPKADTDETAVWLLSIVKPSETTPAGRSSSCSERNAFVLGGIEQKNALSGKGSKKTAMKLLIKKKEAEHFSFLLLITPDLCSHLRYWLYHYMFSLVSRDCLQTEKQGRMIQQLAHWPACHLGNLNSKPSFHTEFRSKSFS